MNQVADRETCGACRWWRDGGTAEFAWGSCERTECEGIRCLHPESRAHAARGPAGVAAVLLTRRDFGCNQWQARDQDT
jgi:hypothetical protein